MKPRLAQVFDGDHGASTLEFALTAPLIVLILVSMLEVATAMNAYVTIGHASREGARYAALHPSASPAAIVRAVDARSKPLDTSKLIVEISYGDWTSFGPWPEGGLPFSRGGPASVAVRVEVRYPWSATSWLAGRFLEGDAARMLSAASTMETRR